GLSYAVDGAGNVEVFHTDGLGSVRAVTNAAASVTQTYLTDAFGAMRLTQGSSGQPFDFTGEQRDGETGFVYLRARVYDPQVGRFLQRDTVAQSGPGSQGLNRYSYAANNPVNSTDPSGHCLGLDRRLFSYCLVAVRALTGVGSALVASFGGPAAPAPMPGGTDKALSQATAATVYRVQGGVLPNASKIRFVLDEAKQNVSIAGDDMLFININQEARAMEFLAKWSETAYLVRF
ncbi:MAG: RHS repeat-associated core domain-containing protein, partial [Chloroflexi bacterium]|nr:RHS repeat-associated core domain-containing protein [Chloroflexota bacterium]